MRIARIHIPLIVTIHALLALMLQACSRSAPTLEPTGWVSVGEPFDSLSRMLDIGMAFDMPDDSVMILSKQFADYAFGTETSEEIRHRAHYWLARAARRTGDEAVAREEFDKSLASPNTIETDYIRRRIAWHDGDPDSLSRNERYHFLRREIEYYEQRGDALMLFGRYIDMFRLMRDIGYTSRQLEYLARADSCISVLSRWREIIGPRFNTACTLIDNGDTAAARSICLSLADNPKVLADPDLNALAQYNLYVVTGEGSSLDNAYRIMKETGNDPYALFPIVCAHKALAELRDGNPEAAKMLVSEMESRLGTLGQSDNLLVALRAKAAVMEKAGTSAEAADALREYAEAADSLQAQQTRDAVIDTETLAEVKKYEDMLSSQNRRHDRIMLSATIVFLIVVCCGVLFAIRLLKESRKRSEDAELSLKESERRALAIRIQAEKSGSTVEGIETFEQLFSRIRPQFIDRMRRRCPTLGNSSIRVACYIVMGLDTKEIAEIMNVRPESIKQTRWRLRKALGVPSDINLQTFLVDLEK